MTGRRLCTEAEAIAQGFDDPRSARRRVVLRETIAALASCDPPDYYQQLARKNLARWRIEAASPRGSSVEVQVLPGDWGEVTGALTVRHGECFAVLNMANAYVPGGAYVEGAAAQEENLFRRTDCHFAISADEYDADADVYRDHMTQLLSAEDGRVHLDVDRPRVCIRGPEDRSRADLGYEWLASDEVFPFFELRAAAQDLRGFAKFDDADARRRIAAQLDTLRAHGVRHAVLGAFGCGAFRNPAGRVAQLYREEIDARASDFAVIAFAIFNAGYGPDNFKSFRKVFDGRRNS